MKIDEYFLGSWDDFEKAVKVGEAGNPFSNANVVVTGTVNGMNRKDITELLTLLGDRHIPE